MIVTIFGKAKFRLGALIVSEGAMKQLTLSDLTKALARHGRADWGTVDRQRRKMNTTALEHGGKVASLFTAGNGTKFTVITDWNQSTTSVLLPEEE